MNEKYRLNDTIQYLYNQMLRDGILRESKKDQVQYILDMISIYNNDKLDMIEDIIENVKLFGYKEEHILPLYTKLLECIIDVDKKLDIDLDSGKYESTCQIDKLLGR
ncbi:hypothetical protein [Romboutsia lituseburensis]|uniref:hypothetical protein n=1 Tax=Romboutsia lituseburensis TaxID=1537 RepID=UPI00215A2F40|nr:hypothetical protein [Romboutsia lituseburensis]MCR8744562.1 hypothetical protein [Romboutsia lituseburensis]